MALVPLTKKAINKDTMPKYGFRYLEQKRKPLTYVYEFSVEGESIQILEVIDSEGKVIAFCIKHEGLLGNSKAFKDFQSKYYSLEGKTEIDIAELKEALISIIKEQIGPTQAESTGTEDIQQLADYVQEQSTEMKEAYSKIYQQLKELEVTIVKIDNMFNDFVCDWGKVSEIEQHPLRKQQAKLEELSKTGKLSEITKAKQALNKVQQVMELGEGLKSLLN